MCVTGRLLIRAGFCNSHFGYLNLNGLGVDGERWLTFDSPFGFRRIRNKLAADEGASVPIIVLFFVVVMPSRHNEARWWIAARFFLRTAALVHLPPRSLIMWSDWVLPRILHIFIIYMNYGLSCEWRGSRWIRRIIQFVDSISHVLRLRMAGFSRSFVVAGEARNSFVYSAAN